jgi:hypothetical protein
MPTDLQAVLRAVDDGQQPAVHVLRRQQLAAVTVHATGVWYLKALR